MSETLGRDAALECLGGAAARSYIADHFGKYANPIELTRFLARYELFKKVVDIKGSVVECGIKSGAGLLEWWHLTHFLDPHDHRRCVFGFDTFEGFPSVSVKDGPNAKVGDMADGVYEDILRCIEFHENNEKVFIIESVKEGGVNAVSRYHRTVYPIKGDFMRTGPEFVEKNPHLVFSLVFLDFDLYEPTKKAIELFLPRMPKGAILAFDELNNSTYPGETLAVLETLGIRNLNLRKFPFNQDVCYTVL